MNRSFRALLLAELRIQFREYMTWVWLLLGALLVGGGLAWLAGDGEAKLLPDDDNDDGVEETSEVEPRWRVDGEVPAWLDQVVTPIVTEDATLWLTVSQDRPPLLTVGGTDDDLVDRAISRLEKRRAKVRKKRLRKLDLPTPGQLVKATVEGEVQDNPVLELTTQLSLATSAAMLLYLTIASMLVESLPRSRDTGYLSTLLTLNLHRGGMLAAWSVAAIFWGVLAVLAMATGWLVMSMFLPNPVDSGGLALLALPAVAALSASSTLRLVVMARDLRAASARLGAAPLVAMALYFLAGQAQAWMGPLAGSLVPVGGLALAIAQPTATHLVGATLSSVVVSWGLFAWTAQLLETADEGDQQASPVVRRRARGDWLPEVLLLAAIGLTGSVAWGGTLTERMGQPAIGIAILMVFFYGLPAIAAPWLWRLPVRELLSLSRPPPVGTLLAPVVAAFTLPVGGALVYVTRWLLGSRGSSIETVGESLRDLASSPGGILAMSVGPGICEELLFRGALLGLLRKRFSDGWAIVIQAALFALVHGHPVRLPPTFFIGVVAGVMTVRTRSLWPAIVLHTAHNGVSFLISLMSGGEEPVLDATAWLQSGAAAVVGAAALYGVLRISGSAART